MKVAEEQRGRWSGCISGEVERLHDGKIKQQRATPTLLNIAFTAFAVVARRRDRRAAYESQVLVVKSLVLAMVLFRREQYVRVCVFVCVCVICLLYRNAFHSYAYVNVRILELYGGT